MFGDLPPSSNVTFLMCELPMLRRMALPVSVPPVSEILSTSGDSASARPTIEPSPVTTLSTPGGSSGISFCTSLQNSSMVSGVCWAGLTTTVQPAAMAGASFHAVSMSG